MSFCSEGSVNVCFVVLTTFERRRKKKNSSFEGKVEVLETRESDELVSEVCLCLCCWTMVKVERREHGFEKREMRVMCGFIV